MTLGKEINKERGYRVQNTSYPEDFFVPICLIWILLCTYVQPNVHVWDWNRAWEVSSLSVRARDDPHLGGDGFLPEDLQRQ